MSRAPSPSTISDSPESPGSAAPSGGPEGSGGAAGTGSVAPGRSARFEVDGLCCAVEARQIETKLGSNPAVTALRVDPVHHTVDVTGDVSADEVRRAIGELGMEARPVDAPRPEPSWWDRHGRAVLAAAAGVFFAGTLVAGPLLGAETVAAALAVAAVVAGGRYVFPRGWIAARSGALDMNFLMSVAAVGALAIGELAEAASIMFLFAVAQLLEARSMERARSAIRSLMALAPAEARVLRDGREMTVPADEVRVGEVVVVRPGEKIPVDGEVEVGRSAVDQSPITGESVPVDRGPGDEAFAGTLNGEGALEIRSTRPASDTTLARIVHAVEEAQATRAPSQRFVDRFARVYTPAVVAGAVLLAVIPPLLGLGAWGEWFYRGLALLVVACPCALVISTPVTVVSALAGGARLGILVKGGLHLENAGRARVVALDKTGTLTLGRPEVVSVVALGDVPAARVLELAAGAESRSEHPLAAAVRRRAREDGLAPGTASETRAMAGRGVEATVHGTRVVVGSPRYFAGMGADDARLRAAVHELEAAGRTVLLVGTRPEERAPRPVDQEDHGGPPSVVGALAVADRSRPEAAEGLRGLRSAGIRWIEMLTGDNDAAARAVADELEGAVDSVRAGLLPEEKVAAVRALRERHGVVLMVGDGINDAPALAAADVGVAMGVAGTDVALETADIALMTDDLGRLATLVELARKSERIIRSNIAFALAVKAVFVVLAATGIATLWMAVLADMGASLLVIANGLRALRA